MGGWNARNEAGPRPTSRTLAAEDDAEADEDGGGGGGGGGEADGDGDGEGDEDQLVVPLAKGEVAELTAKMLRGGSVGAGEGEVLGRVSQLFTSMDTQGLSKELYFAKGWRRMRMMAPDGTEQTVWEQEESKRLDIEAFFGLLIQRLREEADAVQALTACCPEHAADDRMCVCASVWGRGGAGSPGEGEDSMKIGRSVEARRASSKGGAGLGHADAVSVGKAVEFLGAGAAGKGKKVSRDREECLVKMMSNKIEANFEAVQAALEAAGPDGAVLPPKGAGALPKWTPKQEKWMIECMGHEAKQRQKESSEEKQMLEMAINLAGGMSSYERLHATITFKHSGLVKQVPLADLLQKSPEGLAILKEAKAGVAGKRISRGEMLGAFI